jgi:hypothetical protein
MTTATEARLGSLRRRIDRLELKAQIGAADARSRMQQHVDELRDEQQAASVSIHHHAGAAEEKLEQLGNEVEITEYRLAAELAEDRMTFTDAVQAELHGWDAYIGRLQAKAAGKPAAAREHAEGAIADLRRHRIAVEESLTAVRSATGDAWRGAKSTVLAALDELKQRADGLRSD